MIWTVAAVIAGLVAAGIVAGVIMALIAMSKDAPKPGD